MARVPTAAEIDAMSEAELEDYLDSAAADPQDTDAPPSGEGPSWLTATGASRAYAWLLAVAGVIGIAACWELIHSEIRLLKEPTSALVCDVNPFVSCGASLDTPQGNLLGVPNAFVGVMAFAVLLALGLLLASGGRLPRWMWWALVVGTLGGVAFVIWFLTQSIVTFGKLCPFCMVIWAVTIPVAAATWGEAARRGHLPVGAAAAGRLSSMRWWIAAAMYLAVIVTLLVSFWDGWVSLLR